MVIFACFYRHYSYIEATQSGQKSFKRQNVIFACSYPYNTVCEHVHRLELQKSFTFLFALAMEQVYRKPHLSVIPVFPILDMHVEN